MTTLAHDAPLVRRATAAAPRLRRLNAAMAALHLVQGVLVLVLATTFALPVTTAFLELNDAGSTLLPTLETAFEVPIAPLVAAFLFLSAAAHLVLVLPRAHGWYTRSLGRGINPARWVEYSLSSTLMIVAIAMLVGVYDAASLLLLAVANATMILCGWLMELWNEGRERVRWGAFWVGCLAGAAPWAAIGLYLVGAGLGPGGPPGFVYAIYGSIFLFFNVFALNMALQYKRVGPWRDYLFGERVYILLSLTAKSALAWQVFAGTLRPV